MMLFKTGIYSALFSLSHGYLMPGQTDKIVYADTRILDPRYARSAENLVCQSEVTHDVMKHLPTGGGGKGGKPAVQEHTEMRAIGCCPAGDPNGKLKSQSYIFQDFNSQVSRDGFKINIKVNLMVSAKDVAEAMFLKMMEIAFAVNTICKFTKTL